MKSIYITSVGPHSGKTAFILALGKQLLAKSQKVGYFKPLSFQPWRIGGKVADEDNASAFGIDLTGKSLEEVEAEHIRRTLELTNGNRTETAKILKIGERTLYRKIKEYGL